MYGVLYALTPELFPTKDRGTGNALAAAANRVFGVMVRYSPLFIFLVFLNIGRLRLLLCMRT